MYSYAVCSEAGQACSPATLGGWKTVLVSRIRACSKDEGQYLQDVYPADGEHGGTERGQTGLPALEPVQIVYNQVLRQSPVLPETRVRIWEK
jgi:hypothetical protein